MLRTKAKGLLGKLCRYYTLSLCRRFPISCREERRLRKLPRRVPGNTYLFNQHIGFVDALTYLKGIEELFIEKTYDITTATDTPYIIDCGANIGLSCLFLKRLYPRSRVVAFEPDPQIFTVLQRNMAAFNLSDVTLHNKAIWNAETTLDFCVEGGLSGRLVKPGDMQNIVQVPTVRLRDFLNQPVDLLKIDIEGAETDVLRDCADNLHNVKALFVEYHSHDQERQTLHDILSILERSGFRYHIKDAYTAQRPFQDRPLMLGMDLQLNVFAFRSK